MTYDVVKMGDNTYQTSAVASQLVVRLHVRRLCYIMNVVLCVLTSMQVESVATPGRGGDQCRRPFS
jgi:hypothetical protein